MLLRPLAAASGCFSHGSDAFSEPRFTQFQLFLCRLHVLA